MTGPASFIGRAVGLAIFHRRFIDAHFAPSIYKLVLGKEVGVEDIAFLDAEMHQSLKWMAYGFRLTRMYRLSVAEILSISEHDITDVIENDFVDEFDNFGVMETIELKANGSHISVTEQNKHEYIRLLCNFRLKGRVEAQLKAFRKGLHEIVSEHALATFDERELEVSTPIYDRDGALTHML